jgi:hypothetical protein
LGRLRTQRRDIPEASEAIAARIRIDQLSHNLRTASFEGLFRRSSSGESEETSFASVIFAPKSIRCADALPPTHFRLDRGSHPDAVSVINPLVVIESPALVNGNNKRKEVAESIASAVLSFFTLKRNNYSRSNPLKSSFYER